MKKRKYTQKKIIIRKKRRGIHLNNNILSKKDILNNIKKEKNILKSGCEIGVIAKKNKKLTQEQINTIKHDINNPRILDIKLSKYFNIYLKIRPNKVITNKGILVRMGKGKGKVKTKGIYLLKDMVCLELKLKKIKNKKLFTTSYINRIFKKYLKKYTFLKIRTSI